MSAPFCLLPKHADELAKRFESGEFSLAKLIALGSEGRRAAFAETVGEANAAHVNANVEAKLMLKGQQTGLENYVKGLKGLKPDVARDLLARVSRMDKVLEPADANAFMADLAARRLGFRATMEQAGKIAELAKEVSDAKALPLNPDGSRPLAYGEARVRFGDYVSGLKNDSRPMTVWGGVKATAGLFKSLVATFDDSIIGRQGLNTLFTDPKIWAKNSLQTFVDMYKTFKGEEVTKALDARIFSDADADLFRRGKLATGIIEEQFPSQLPEKVPVFGRIYKANEAAFQNWQRQTRVDLFKKYVDVARRSGVELDNKQLQEFGSIANSMTGRGDLGKFETHADALNVLLFSGRKLAADLDVLTGHQIRNLTARAKGEAGYSALSQKIAAQNLAKVVVGTATLMVLTEKLWPDTIEPDARSASFGTVTTTVDDEADVTLAILADMLGFGVNTYAGKTHIDITGGKRGLITLAARIARKSTKNGTTGEITPLYKGGFNQKDVTELLSDFAANKRSPAVAMIWAMYTQQQRNGDPLTLESFAKEHAPIPASVQNAIDLVTPETKKAKKYTR